MSRTKLNAARELILAKEYEAAIAVLETMRYNETAQQWLAKLDEIAPAEYLAVADSKRQGWEYRIVALDPPGVTEMTIYDTGTPDGEIPYEWTGNPSTSNYLGFIAKYLNNLGAQGWELVSVLKPMHSNEATFSNYTLGQINGAPAFLMKRQRR